MHCNRQRSEDGFTLVELLVAFSILGLVAAASFSALGTSLMLWSDGQSRIDEARVREDSLLRLRDQVRGALPLNYQLADGRERVAFEGSGDNLRLVPGSSFVRPIEIAHWMELRWEPGSGSRGRLIGEERRILSPSNRGEDEPYWQGTVLEAESFEIWYLNTDASGQPGNWVERWQTETGQSLPLAVRFNIRFSAGDSRTILVPLDYAAPVREGLVVR